MSQFWRHNVCDGDNKVVVVTLDDMEIGIERVGGHTPITDWLVSFTAYSVVYGTLL